MHRPKISPLLLTVLIFSASVFAAAQANQARFFPVPERLALNGIGESDPNEEDTPAKLMTENFYPIGWSRDGKFAYLVEPPDEACGCYFAEFVIQDLKTDKILFKERYSSDGLEKPEEENLGSFWPKRQKVYSARLNQHRIEPIGDAHLMHPAINFEGDVLTSKLDIKIETDGVFEVEGTVTLTMTSAKRGSKVIRRDVYKRKDVNGFRDAEITGSLKSPFESRVAVILVEVMRGWEGPPNTTSIKVTGASLTTGFKK
jgi:hypothetical protein